MTTQGQLDIFGAIAEVELEQRIQSGGLRNGLMLDVTDIQALHDYAKAWREYRESQGGTVACSGFHGFHRAIWGETFVGEGHEANIYISDLRCVHTLPGGFANDGLVFDDCHCVGDWYERIYCTTCDWWSPIITGLGRPSHVLAHEHVSKPPFTGYTGPERHGPVPCGWCGKRGMHSEGGGGPASDECPAYGYAVCAKCQGKNRVPARSEWRFEEA